MKVVEVTTAVPYHPRTINVTIETKDEEDEIKEFLFSNIFSCKNTLDRICTIGDPRSHKAIRLLEHLAQQLENNR